MRLEHDLSTYVRWCIPGSNLLLHNWDIPFPRGEESPWVRKLDSKRRIHRQLPEMSVQNPMIMSMIQISEEERNEMFSYSLMECQTNVPTWTPESCALSQYANLHL